MGAGQRLSGRRQDGSTFPAEISLSAVETENGLLIIAAVRDVSDRLRDEAERARLQADAERERSSRKLLQSQRLESLGQLAGGVAHDFNNLLGVISNYAAFVSEEVAREPAVVDLATVREDMEQIAGATQRAAGLTRQLLAFARREVLQPQVWSLNDIVTDLQQMLTRTLGEHVNLATGLAPDLGNVLVDRGQVEQVLVNLAVNARDAMPQGGCLTIETGNIELDEVAAAGQVDVGPGQYASLKVSDTGCGISREVAERAFEPFYTTKPSGEGSGLGLATVYGIIKQAGGTVRIYSEPGLGTTVTVLLPRTGQVRAAAERPAPAAACAGGLILIVEDEPALRQVTRRLLERNGYHVLAAAGGAEAIALAGISPGRIDLLLTDVIMPGMQGQEVATRFSAIQPSSRVLFMSGYTQGILGTQGVLAPGVELIEKPFSEASLLSKVREVLAGWPSQPAAPAGGVRPWSPGRSRTHGSGR